MTQNASDTVDDYAEVECANNDCSRMVTTHVDDANESLTCWSCSDNDSGKEGNATFPAVGGV